MPTEIGFRGADCPVGIRYVEDPTGVTHTFVTRAQEFLVEKAIPKDPVFEMGRFDTVGYLPLPERYTGQLTVNAMISDPIERYFVATDGGWVTQIQLQNYIDGPDFWLTSPHGELGFARLASVEYRATSGPTAATTTFRFIGKTMSVPVNTISDDYVHAPNLDMPGAYYAGTVQLTISTGPRTILERVQSVVLRADLGTTELYQLNTDPGTGVNTWLAGIAHDPPTVSAEIEAVLHDDYQGTIYEDATMLDMSLRFGDPSEDYFPLKAVVMPLPRLTGVPARGNVRGWSTVTFRYMGSYGQLMVNCATEAEPVI